jgi:aspartate kinase
VLDEVAASVGAEGVVTDKDIAKISLIGAGMKTHPGVAADMFDALSDAGINIEIISTSSIRVSCVIRALEVERAVKALHDKFELTEEAIIREQHPATATGQLRAINSRET